MTCDTAERSALLPRTRFTLPAGSDASEPPEHRGLTRDGVRLLVARRGAVEHRRFSDLPDLLVPGDVVVINTSATLPAAIDAEHVDGTTAPVHVSTSLPDRGGSRVWVVEVRRPDGSGPDFSVRRGSQLNLPGGVRLRLGEPYPDASVAGWSRLWRAEVAPPQPLRPYLSRHGRPITYNYLSGRWPLTDYQTVYAGEPGSAEMVSAGRPFTPALLVRLASRGVPVVPLVLHTGVSSPELHEPPAPEEFSVPEVTARLVTSTRAVGRRVVAVGTTVVRALETVTGVDGVTRSGHGWTDLVLGPDHPTRVVNGLISGLHAPESSHLLLLEAVAGPDLLDAAYHAAVERRYLWHEFGDSMLLLP